MAVNNFSISVCMRTPSDEMTRGMLHQQCITGEPEFPIVDML
jgi:hypothetical protein